MVTLIKLSPDFRMNKWVPWIFAWWFCMHMSSLKLSLLTAATISAGLMPLSKAGYLRWNDPASPPCRNGFHWEPFWRAGALLHLSGRLHQPRIHPLRTQLLPGLHPGILENQPLVPVSHVQEVLLQKAWYQREHGPERNCGAVQADQGEERGGEGERGRTRGESKADDGEKEKRWRGEAFAGGPEAEFSGGVEAEAGGETEERETKRGVTAAHPSSAQNISSTITWSCSSGSITTTATPNISPTFASDLFFPTSSDHTSITFPVIPVSFLGGGPVWRLLGGGPAESG